MSARGASPKLLAFASLLFILSGCSALRLPQTTTGDEGPWRFDLTSALIGSAVTWSLVIVLYLNRVILLGQLDATLARAKQLRENVTSGADRRYRRELAEMAGQLRVGTTNAPLESVYLPPFLRAPLPEPNPFAPPDTAVDWVAWAWPDVRRVLPGRQRRVLRLGQVFTATWRVALTGEPGTGKSTLLSYLALVAAGGATHADFTFDDSPLPIWIHLADLLDDARRASDDPANALIDAAVHRMGSITGQRLPGLARRRLREGRCIVLMDGLDELLPAERTVAVEWLDRFVRRYGDNRFVVAAPPTGYKPLRDLGFYDLTFMPWNRRALQRISERWEAAIAPRRANSDDEEEEFAPLKVPGWMETPLDVALWQQSQIANAEPPAHRLGLYRGAVALALRAPEKLPAPAPRGGTAFTGLSYLPVAAGEAFLAGAAFDMLSTGRSAEPRQELELRISDVLAQQQVEVRHDNELLLERLERYSGLLAVHAHRRLAFTHPTVRSYLAARHLASVGESGLVKTLVSDPAWTETLRFHAGLTDVGALVGELLSTPHSLLRDEVINTAVWAGVAAPNAPWRGPLMAAAARMMLQPGELPLTRERATAALVVSNDPGVGLLLKRALSAPDETLRLLACQGLGALGEQGPGDAITLLRARLADEASAVRLAAAHALSAIGSDQAIEGLVHALLEGDDELRRAAAEGLGANPGEGYRVLQDGITDRDYLVRRATAYGLLVPAMAGNDWATELLQAAERDDGEWFVRSAATEGLQRLSELYTTQQLVLPRADNLTWLIQWAAQQGHGVGTGPAALKVLGAALLDDDPRIRAAGALTLAMVGEASAEEPLRRLALLDPQAEVREACLIAVAALWRTLGSPVTAKASAQPL